MVLQQPASVQQTNWRGYAVHSQIHGQGKRVNFLFHFAPQPNLAFNADANTGNGFGIVMACVGALRASRCGAG
jgi:hypothetical protein